MIFFDVCLHNCQGVSRRNADDTFMYFLTASSVAIAVLQVAVLVLLAILSISLYNDNIML